MNELENTAVFFRVKVLAGQKSAIFSNSYKNRALESISDISFPLKLMELITEFVQIFLLCGQVFFSHSRYRKIYELRKKMPEFGTHIS